MWLYCAIGLAGACNGFFWMGAASGYRKCLDDQREARRAALSLFSLPEGLEPKREEEHEEKPGVRL